MNYVVVCGLEKTAQMTIACHSRHQGTAQHKLRGLFLPALQGSFAVILKASLC